MDSAWTGSVNPETPWPDYPRPQMQRNAWLNLNGPWEFAGSVGLASGVSHCRSTTCFSN